MGGSKPQSLSNIAAAYSKIEFRDRPLSAAISASRLRAPPEFMPQMLANTAGACALRVINIANSDAPLVPGMPYTTATPDLIYASLLTGPGALPCDLTGLPSSVEQ